MSDADARQTAAVYWVLSLAVLACTWLLKWSIGLRHGQVDSRLEPSYVARLNRRYVMFVLLNVAAAGVALLSWQVGLAISTLLLLSLLLPPKTPRYFTEAPIVEGES